LLKRTLHGTLHLVGALGAGLAILILALAWRLSAGPISLTPLTAHAESALNAFHPELRFRLGDTILTWGGWERTLDMRIQSVRVFEKTGGVIANIPEISFSLSAQALLRGMLAPRSIELFGPRLFLAHRADGEFVVALDEAQSEGQDLLQRLLNQLLAPPDRRNPMGYLARLNIIGADLTLADLGRARSWRLPAAQVLIARDADGLSGEAMLDFATPGGRGRIDVRGAYRATDGLSEATLTLDRARPAAFAEFIEAFAPFAALDLPLAGTATVTLERNGAVRALGFNLTGGQGRLVLPDPVPQELALRALALKGRYDGAADRLDVEQFRLDLGPGGTFVVPGPAPHAMPLRLVEGRGIYFRREGRAEVVSARADLGGPRLALSATGDIAGGETRVRAKVRLDNVPGNDLSRYWPTGWGADARGWVVPNLSEGSMPRAEANLDMHVGSDGRFRLAAIKGDMDIRDISVNYLAPMPKVRKVSARATFNETRFDIAIEKGEAAGLAVTSGTIAFAGLDQADQYVDIALSIRGGFRDGLSLIESEPLRFATALGVDPKGAEGTVETDLRLRFIIDNTLKAEQVDVRASVRLADVALRGVLLGQDLRQGNLTLALDRKGMDVKGKARVGGMLADIDWRQNFDPKAQVVSRYRLTGRSGKIRSFADLGFAFGPLGEGAVEGTAGADIQVVEGRDGTRTIDARADLKDLAIEVKTLGWRKERGQAGTAEATLRLKHDVVTAIPAFAVASGDLAVKGRAVYAPDGSGLDRIEADPVRYGRTDAKLVLSQRPDGGWDLDVKGTSFDFGPLWSEVLKGGSSHPESDVAAKLKLGISFALDRVWMGEERSFAAVKGAFRHDGQRWRSAEAEGRVGAKGSPFAFAVRPVGDVGKRALNLTAADAGAILKALDFYDHMVGGSLEIAGEYLDRDPGEPLVGRVVARDYRVVNAPLLARLLSVAALTGILDELKGEGLNFSALDLPFVHSTGMLELREGRAYGASLGFTAAGKIYTDADILDMNGTIVPAYAVNSLLGNLPVVGPLFTGGEKGGGVFAATFRMTGPREDPNVAINPVATLAPGFLRNLLGIFGTAGRAAPAREESQ
jgi:hypothetical protein